MVFDLARRAYARIQSRDCLRRLLIHLRHQEMTGRDAFPLVDRDKRAAALHNRRLNGRKFLVEACLPVR